MFGRAAKTAAKSSTGRKAGKVGAKGALKAGRMAGKVGRTRAGQEAGKAGVRGFGRLAKTAAKVKAGKEAGRVGAKGAAQAGRGAGKFALRRGKKEIEVAQDTLNSGSSGGSRFLRYGILVLAGFAIGALVARLGSSEEDSSGSSFTEDSDTTTGEGRTAADTAYSDPASGPLIGESHQGSMEGVTEEQKDVEQRIRTNLGEDERTRDMPRVNVEVNGEVAELRGAAPSEEAKEAAGEIAAEAEGVSEVRNLIEVNS